MKHLILIVLVCAASLAMSQNLSTLELGQKDLQITAMSIDDSDSFLWVGTSHGLLNVSLANKKVHKTKFNGYVTEIAVDNNNNIFVATMDGNIAVSSDQGMTWKSSKLANCPIRALAIDKKNQVIAGTISGKIYSSMDAGASWKCLSSFPFVINSLKISDSQIFYATGFRKNGAGGVILQSLDSGRSWQTVTLSSKHIIPRVVCSARNGILFLASNYGVHQANGLNKNWKYIGLKGAIQNLVIDSHDKLLASSYYGLFQFSKGKCWNRVGRQLDTSALAIDSAGNIYLGSHSGQIFILHAEQKLTLLRTNKRSSGRIVIKKWDVGGGNFLRPKAKILVQVYGQTASRLKLFAVSSDGYIKELQYFYVKDGKEVYFNCRYSRMGTRWLELRLYDNMSSLIARERRSP